MNEYWIIALKIVFVLMAVLNLAAILTWMERKQSALMQDRIGANRADIFGFRAIGLFHIIADSLKMFLKEDFVPPGAQRFLHAIAPIMSAFFALSVAACIPFGKLMLAGQTIYLQVIDLNAGVLYLIAMMSFSIYGVFLAGWASRSKYSLLGALRGASQMLSYEIAMGISLIGIIMIHGSLSLRHIVYGQGELLFGFLPAWGIFLQPIGFIIFLTAGMAETKRVPFDLPEGESEIIGYFTEYSSMRFGLFFLTDFIEVALVAMLVTVFFFGGWQIPYLQDTGFVFPWGGSLAMSPLLVGLLGVLVFFLKVIFFCWLQLTIRWTLPRFRYDQLMKLGWKYMLPLAMANVIATGLVLILLD
jgi:NADH-quinone oxidoreductase subunit H